MNDITHVVLCGGAGTRLWPLSNARQPKQLLKIFGDNSLLQLAVLRNAGLSNRIIAVSSAAIATQVEEQLDDLHTGLEIVQVVEPAARNTAAAIALAALISDPEAILLVTPSDHLVGTPDLYKEAVAQAVLLAADDYLVTFGLKPLYPETGYGYIQYLGHDVIRFAEKPSLPMAETFVEAGDYLWNSGIFCFKAGVFLEELKGYAPDIYDKSVVAAAELKATGRISVDTMLQIPSNSIDYAVMENSRKVKVVPTAMDWSDVGSYEALSDALVSHYNHRNEGAVFVESNPEANTIISKDKLVALVGVDDLVVVNTPDAILIMKKGYGQHVKQVHQWVKENKPDLQ